MPVVAIGFSLWAFISGITNEGTSVFVEAETFVRQMRINFCLFVLRIIARNIVVFLNNLIVALCVIVICGKFSLSTLPLGILGILLVFYQGVWIVPLLGIIGTRFRDLQPLIQSVLLVLFLVTPIFWLPELLGPRQFIAELNPLTHFIEVARKPLLGEILVGTATWLFSLLPSSGRYSQPNYTGSSVIVLFIGFRSAGYAQSRSDQR